MYTPHFSQISVFGSNVLQQELLVLYRRMLDDKRQPRRHCAAQQLQEGLMRSQGGDALGTGPGPPVDAACWGRAAT